MIAIFTLLGLGLFGGGLYAIYDGWPYLVLERGFTEVIIGSIAASAGLIMLSLAWVLKQLKTIRTELAEAAEARATAVLPAEIASAVAPTTAPSVAPAARGPAVPPPILPAVVGAGATAVAAVVAEKSEPLASASGNLERDLFGKLVADRLSTPDENEDEDKQEEATVAERDETVPDMFAKDFADPAPAEIEHPVDVEEEGHEPAEIVAAHIQPLSQDEALARSDEQAEAVAENAEIGEFPSERSGPSMGDRTDAGRSRDEHDDFAMLRESLTSQLGGVHRPGGRIEPSFEQDDPFAAAEAWIKPAAEREEPRFDAGSPAADGEKTEEVELPVPAWPPRTEAPGLAAVPAHEADRPTEAIVSEEPEAQPAPEQSADTDEAGQDARERTEEPAPESDNAGAATPEPAAPEPAASEEGIVGAYQVGEAHFTIYADGSIRARTPDGEYSFASMDELKVYLASEKSRLGG